MPYFRRETFEGQGFVESFLCKIGSVASFGSTSEQFVKVFAAKNIHHFVKVFSSKESFPL